VQASARVHFGDLTPEDVMVELYLGRVNADREIIEPEITRMRPVESRDEGGYVFEASAAPCRKSGRHGYTVRVLPHHPDIVDPFLLELIVWTGSDVKAT
jgi:starch phosphorylase